MTQPTDPYSDVSSPTVATGPVGGLGPDAATGSVAGAGTRVAGLSAARRISEPYRQLAAWSLLVGNGAFLLLGLTGLLLVLDRWVDDFGARSAAQFGDFVGPLPLALPILAVLLATHIAPAVPQARAIVLTALVQYGVSALLGAITFLGAFADNLDSARATLEGLLERVVWLGFLVLGVIVVSRLLIGLFPSPSKQYVGYPAPTYGWPYPGQPVYPASPQPTAAYQSGLAEPTVHVSPPTPDLGLAATMAVPPPPSAYTVPTTFVSAYPDELGPDLDGAVAPLSPPDRLSLVDPRIDDALFDEPTADTGWPVVPPPPMPTPPAAIAVPSVTPVVTPVVEFEPTMRVTPITPRAGEAAPGPRPDQDASEESPAPDR